MEGVFDVLLRIHGPPELVLGAEAKGGARARGVELHVGGGGRGGGVREGGEYIF